MIYYDMNKIHKPLKDEFMSEVKELLDTNNFVFGTDKFEEDFAEYTVQNIVWCKALRACSCTLFYVRKTW